MILRSKSTKSQHVVETYGVTAGTVQLHNVGMIYTGQLAKLEKREYRRLNQLLFWNKIDQMSVYAQFIVSDYSH